MPSSKRNRERKGRPAKEINKKVSQESIDLSNFFTESYIALQEFLQGYGSLHHCSVLNDLGHLLGIAGDVRCFRMPRMVAAGESCTTATVNAKMRFDATNKWGFTGDEIKAIREALNCLDYLLKNIPSGRMVMIVKALAIYKNSV